MAASKCSAGDKSLAPCTLQPLGVTDTSTVLVLQCMRSLLAVCLNRTISKVRRCTQSKAAADGALCQPECSAAAAWQAGRQRTAKLLVAPAAPFSKRFGPEGQLANANFWCWLAELCRMMTSSTVCGSLANLPAAILHHEQHAGHVFHSGLYCLRCAATAASAL